MYFNDHNPPHFHVEYGDYHASIAIENLAVLEGNVPSRILGFTIEWASLHKHKLMENWNMIKSTGKYFKIEPLI